MKRKLRNTFKSGDIARLANISKQTLSYYEREGLLKPALRDDNNRYAYYSLTEHHKLEMVVCLRNLGFSIKEIKRFMEYRNENILIDMLQMQQKRVLEEQQELAEKQRKIQNILRKTLFIKNIILGRVSLEQLPEYNLYVSERLSDVDGDKNNLIIRLNFFKQIFPYNQSDFNSGWFLTAESIKNLRFSPVSRFFAIDTGHNEETGFKKLINYKVPSQFYVSIYGKGNYHNCCKSWTEPCLAFIQHNHLRISGDVLVVFIKDYWMTNDKNEYIFKLSIPVK